MNAPEKFFEQQDRVGVCPEKFATFVAQSIAVQSKEDFIALIKNVLHPIFPHGMLLEGIGHTKHVCIVVERVIAINYPRAYVDKIKKQRTWVGPILANCLRTQRPQLYELGNLDFPVPPGWARAMQRHNLQNIAAHGMKDSRSHGARYFTFSRIPELLAAEHARLLEMIVPMLHQVLVRIHTQSDSLPIAPKDADQPPGLNATLAPRQTAREREILSWLRQGKTNIEIAVALRRSPNTARNQLQQLFTKFQGQNRTQLIALVASENDRLTMRQ